MSDGCRARAGATVGLLADLVEGPGHGDGEEEAGGGRDPVDCPCRWHSANHAEHNLAQLGLEVEAKEWLFQIGESREEKHEEKWACEAGQYGHHLTGGQGSLVHLHPTEQEEGEDGRHHETAALVQGHALCNTTLLFITVLSMF